MRYTCRNVPSQWMTRESPKFFAMASQARRRSADQLTVFSSQIGIGTLLQGELNGKGSYHIRVRWWVTVISRVPWCSRPEPTGRVT